MKSKEYNQSSKVYNAYKNGKLKGFGEWCIMYIAKYRCKAKCWVPKDSKIRKKMIEKKMITPNVKNHDKVILEKILKRPVKRFPMHIYFNEELSKLFDTLHRS